MSVYELSPDQKLRLWYWMREKGRWSEDEIARIVEYPSWPTVELWDQMRAEDGAT